MEEQSSKPDRLSVVGYDVEKEWRVCVPLHELGAKGIRFVLGYVRKKHGVYRAYYKTELGGEESLGEQVGLRAAVHALIDRGSRDKAQGLAGYDISKKEFNQAQRDLLTQLAKDFEENKEEFLP